MVLTIPPVLSYEAMPLDAFFVVDAMVIAAAPIIDTDLYGGLWIWGFDHRQRFASLAYRVRPEPLHV